MISPDLEGIIHHDHLRWPNYVSIGGKVVSRWIYKRLAEIPEGSYVKISVEIMDVPHDESPESLHADMGF